MLFTGVSISDLKWATLNCPVQDMHFDIVAHWHAVSLLYTSEEWTHGTYVQKLLAIMQ